MKVLLIALLTFTAVSCLKTAEQVKREQRVETMSQQLADSQNIVADMTVMLKSLQTQIDQLSGKVEELQHAQKATSGVNFQEMNENLNLLRQQVQSLSETQKQHGQEITEQRSFIEKVTDKLGKMGTQRSDSAKKNPKSDIETARALIQKKKYSDAREILEGMVDNSEVTPGDQNKALHALGTIEYEQKNFEKGLVFFSKVYTKYPKSSLAPSSLLFIARSLAKLGKKEEAKQAFSEVITNYPGSSSAKDAKRESAKL